MERAGRLRRSVVVYPPNFSRDKKYQLVLYIRGGPQMASNTSFTSFTSLDPLPQLLAAHGYVVFEPNYRGSTTSAISTCEPS